MMIDALLEDLKPISGATVRAGEAMARHTPLRVGGPAEIWASVDDLEALSAVLSASRRHKVPWRICWPLGDWLVRDGGVRGLVVRLGAGFEGVRVEDGLVWLGAAALWSQLGGRPMTEALDAVSRFPGSVGGLLSEGDAGQLGGLVRRIRLLRGRRIEEITLEPGEDLPVIPGTAVILEVALATEQTHIKGRRKPRLPEPPPPAALFNATDELPVAAMLARAGVGNARLRSWRLSATGTVIQLGGGTCKDVLLLASGLADRVQRERGVELKTRLSVVGVDLAATA